MSAPGASESLAAQLEQATQALGARKAEDAQTRADRERAAPMLVELVARATQTAVALEAMDRSEYERLHAQLDDKAWRGTVLAPAAAINRGLVGEALGLLDNAPHIRRVLADIAATTAQQIANDRTAGGWAVGVRRRLEDGVLDSAWAMTPLRARIDAGIADLLAQAQRRGIVLPLTASAVGAPPRAPRAGYAASSTREA